MKEPKQFPKVVKLGMGIVIVIYVTMGFLGYLTCQNECKGSITLNLPGTPYVYIYIYIKRKINCRYSELTLMQFYTTLGTKIRTMSI